MSAIKNKCLFGLSDLKMTPQVLSQLAFICSPDSPVAETVLLGDYALTEICVAAEEARLLKSVLGMLRTEGQKKYISDVLDTLTSEGKQKHNPQLTKLAESMELEYQRIVRVFFLRCRCFIVVRNSTHEVVGRFVVFPDMISDDFGNNLEQHQEKGMNVIKASQANHFKGRSTIYLGYGQGSAMAQLCGYLNDEPVIVLDGNFLSEILVQQAIKSPLPKSVRMAPRKHELPWNVMFNYLEASLVALEPVLPAAMEIAARLATQNDEKKPGEDDAENFFSKRCTYEIRGVTSQATAVRAKRAGRFSSSTMSNLLNDYMTTVKPKPFPFALPVENS